MNKKIGIICLLDRFANAVRPIEIKKFLEKKGYEVKLINTHSSREAPMLLELFNKTLTKMTPSILKQCLLIRRLRSRAKNLSRKIKKEKFYAVICESESDFYILTKHLDCLKILDCPSPWIDELYYNGKLSGYIYKKLRKMELEVYKKTDYLSFHWENYTKYVQKYIYNGKNIFILNWGCRPKPEEKKARFAYPPKIVFLGSLGGYWNNLPLLSKLSKLSQIDVYGAPEPDKKYGLNYKGYAPSTDVLSEYQFGVITITKDKLRRHSFSSKHLEYMSYGLPVLTPDWRKDIQLAEVSIPYDEKNFLKKIKEYSSKKKWQEMSNRCYNQAKKWRWEKVLEPLGKIVKEG